MTDLGNATLRNLHERLILCAEEAHDTATARDLVASARRLETLSLDMAALSRVIVRISEERNAPDT